MAKKTGPLFLRFYVPLIEVLRELGGSAKPAEATDLVIEKLGISEAEQADLVKGGQSRVRNQVGWARFYLAKTGYIDGGKQGVWRLTEMGLKTPIAEIDTYSDFRVVQKRFAKSRASAAAEENEEELATVDDAVQGHGTQLLSILKSLPPDGFERICQRLLRESGFEQVMVTGKSGDGGIDGHGILELNAFVSFKVLFQCKRYEGSVPCSKVRDFRGAMQGRADKGIIITTGTFTTEARKEARRDGAPPIELVDGEKLVDLFEKLELGLKPVTAYEIDAGFFEGFR